MATKEIGVPYKTELIDWPEGEQRQPYYLGISAKSNAPALQRALAAEGLPA